MGKASSEETNTLEDDAGEVLPVNLGNLQWLLNHLGGGERSSHDALIVRNLGDPESVLAEYRAFCAQDPKVIGAGADSHIETKHATGPMPERARARAVAKPGLRLRVGNAAAMRSGQRQRRALLEFPA